MLITKRFSKGKIYKTKSLHHYITTIPVLAVQNLHISQTPSQQRRDAWPTNCTPKDAHASVFFYTSSTPHARHIRTRFELWGRPFCSSLLASFCLPFGVATKGIYSTQLHCHISFLSFVWLTTCFLPSQGWLLDSCKCRLFCLHIQYATHCLFEQRTPVSSSEAAVCRFCLSISLQSSWMVVLFYSVSSLLGHLMLNLFILIKVSNNSV